MAKAKRRSPRPKATIVKRVAVKIRGIKKGDKIPNKITVKGKGTYIKRKKSTRKK